RPTVQRAALAHPEEGALGRWPAPAPGVVPDGAGASLRHPLSLPGLAPRASRLCSSDCPLPGCSPRRVPIKTLPHRPGIVYVFVGSRGSDNPQTIAGGPACSCTRKAMELDKKLAKERQRQAARETNRKLGRKVRDETLQADLPGASGAQARDHAA